MKRYLLLLASLTFLLTAGHAQSGYGGDGKTAGDSSSNTLLRLYEPAPTAATTALAGAGAGSVDNGAHIVKVTCYTPGGETTGGTVSNTTTVADKTSNGKIAISAIPTCSSLVTGRKVYMTAAGGSTYYLLSNGTIANNTTTTLTANDSDATLAASTVLPTTNTALDARLTAASNSITLKANLLFTDQLYSIGAPGANRPYRAYIYDYVTTYSGAGYGLNGNSGLSQGMAFSGTTTKIIAGSTGGIAQLSDPGGNDYFVCQGSGCTVSGRVLKVANATVTASAGASLSLDMSTGNIRTVTFGAGNITSLTATNVPVGWVTIMLIQDGTGSRTASWDTAVFKAASATFPTLSTGAGKKDVLFFQCDGTLCYLQSSALDVR